MRLDDICTGDFIVIVRWHEKKQKHEGGGPFSMMPEHVVEVENTDRVGLPLYVIGVSLPFVAVATPAKQVFHLDVRKVELMRSNETYFRACVAGVPKTGSLTFDPLKLSWVFDVAPDDEVDE